MILLDTHINPKSLVLLFPFKDEEVVAHGHHES